MLATRFLAPLAAALLAAVFATAAFAAEPAEFSLTIRDHRFEPAELQVPAGTRIRLVVHNEDATPEEFESDDLDREKVVAGKSSVVVLIGPLQAGRYEFYGEFHSDTARGHIVVKK